MNKNIINRNKTEYFTSLSNTLVYAQEELSPFISAPFSKTALKRQAHLKKEEFSKDQRELLVEVIGEQMSAFDYKKVNQHLDDLKEKNTVTITTGHQLNLYTGPMYVIYKIMHVIKLAEQMNKEDHAMRYVPIFWMATEDHDFEEINHFHLFNDTVSWETEQRGPVGRFGLDDFESVRTELRKKFENNQSFLAFLEKHYSHGSLAQATRHFVMDLFGEYGLIVLDADDVKLKKSFRSVMKTELSSQFSEPLVKEVTKLLEKHGYDGQVTPRPINLFYIQKGRRDRIIPQNGGFIVGNDRFTQEELYNLLDQHPERFSPNVVLRPVYQEFVLPNICYVGGGGEMSYWLQLKGVFEFLNVPYPVIQVRNSVQFIDGIALKKMKKLDLSVEELFEDIHVLKKKYVLEDESSSLDFASLEELGEELADIYEDLITSVDKGLEGYGKSEVKRLQKQIEGIKEKLVRHQKKKHEEALNQMDNLFERLFPAGGLQERYDNIIPRLAKYGKTKVLEELHEHMDPEEKGLILLIEE